MSKYQNKKGRKWLKRTIISLVIFFVISTIATIAVGNYFINYALARTGGGGDRNVKTEAAASDSESAETAASGSESTEAVSGSEDTEAAVTGTSDLASLIDQNRSEAEKSADEWKVSLDSKEVSITAEDGITLRGTEYINNQETGKWVIVAHGYHSDPESVLPIGEKFYEQGYNVLVISMRAHADSDGKYIGMGWLDRLDLLKWIDLIISEYPEAEIILHGTSMGAAAVMMTAGEELPANVKAIVEDSGYTSVWDIFSSELKVRFGLPPFPVMYMVDAVADVEVGYGFKEASALKQVKKSKVPILFIHGDADDFVPVDMVYKLYDAATCEKDILVIKGADHTEGKYADPEEYYNKVFSFLDKYVK